ncbi:uncharacterized protein LOC130934618 [Arachis stenosperma]|uniref:uncharacterized protein LOC130934618 n=1 Tax=Arachis stenosperma TaxID=217475 RepID=UPI0025AC7047|nr:uncharacterized protein LOC130934618 [Arachis stenosperma]
MECVTTASISLLINESSSKPFKMERGLRQGDPLSLFLFVLVVDVLHRMIGEAIRNGRILLLLVGRDSIELSHLHFADDTILFCPPVEEIIKNYKRLLRCFELMSGSKSEVGEYLEAYTRQSGGKTQPLKAKVPNKAVKAVVEKLISLQRRFLWSKEDGKNGIALVRWELVQDPKKLGGLGVGNAMIRNTALLFKWWWQFAKEECPLWKKVVCSCNSLNPNEFLSAQVLPTRGGPWKDICQDKFLRLFSVSNQCGSVIGDCEFRDGLEWIWNFQWRRELFHLELELHEALRPVKLVLQEEMLPEEVTSYSFTKTIWKGLVPPRVERFVWFVVIGRVNTKERLSRFGIVSTDNSVCVLCMECLDSRASPSMVLSGIHERAFSKLDRRTEESGGSKAAAKLLLCHRVEYLVGKEHENLPE